MKYVLTIAGSDSCGGAGIQADIKTIVALGTHALTAITAVTAQNSLGVSAVHEIPLEFIAAQIKTVLEDVSPDAVKLGMLPSGGAIETIAGAIRRYGFKNVVADPVMKASTGRELMNVSAVTALKELLLPLARVVTPNLYEAGVLSGGKVTNPDEMEWAAREIKKLGPDVIVKGGHLDGNCIDILYDGRNMYRLYGERIETADTHGTGCVFSSSLATFLAMGKNIVDAARLSHDFTRCAIENGYPCGKGPGVVAPSTEYK